MPRFSGGGGVEGAVYSAPRDRLNSSFAIFGPFRLFRFPRVTAAGPSSVIRYDYSNDGFSVHRLFGRAISHLE